MAFNVGDTRRFLTRLSLTVCFIVVGLTTASLRAEDWPQWRGVDRDGVWTDTGVVERFPDSGLQVRWRVPIRGGFASPAVAGGRVFVLDYEETPGSRTMDGTERLLALDEETGAVLWTQTWPAAYRNIQWKFANGPRTPPTVDGDRVYVLGAAGMISCLDAATGEAVWQVDTAAEYGATVPVYGVSHAPLVEGDVLIIVVGGEPDAKIVGFDKATGEERWRALEMTSETGYSSPIVIDAGGVRQLIFWHATALVSLNPETGETYWEQAFRNTGGLSIGTPVRSGRYLLISQFRTGSMMMALNRDSPTARMLWKGQSRIELPHMTEGLHAMMSTPIIIGDYLYGVGSYGELRGLDATTGERLWQSDALTPQGRFGTAYFVRNGDRYFVTNDAGELVIARFTPEGYEEIDRTPLLEPTLHTRGGASGRWSDRTVLWAHPAFANGHVVARNDREIIRASLVAADYADDITAVPVLTARSGAAPDARAVLEAAADTMGVTDMTSIQYSGTGWIGGVGQSYAPDQDWPRFELASYTRTIDFDTYSSKEEMVIRQGRYAARGGGAPIRGERRRSVLVSGTRAWNIEGDRVVPMPAASERRMLEILLTPHGFLKGAMSSHATAVTRNEYGGRVTVVSFLALGRYRVNGTITEDHVVQRVQTWLPNPVVGDMYYETVYTEYEDVGGVQFPMRWHQHQDYDDGAHQPNVSGGDHAFGLETISDVRINVDGAALTVPDAVRGATVPPVGVETEQLADGVWLLGGGSHNSVAVEFRDHVAVIEAPLNEARSLAVIEEVMSLAPTKPIRFIVNTHHHWDHLGGLRTYVHDGATVITHEGNRPYYQEVLRARPWLLDPDRFSLSPPEEWSEGYIFETVGEKYILGDEGRTVELHHVRGLDHVAGMLIAYFPQEKLVVEADLYTPPPPGDSSPGTPSASSRTFYENLQRLNLDVETIVPIHGRPTSMSAFVEFVRRAE